MGLYEPGKSKINLSKDGFAVDRAAIDSILETVGEGEVVNLTPDQISPLASGIANNPNFSYCAGSGISTSVNYADAFCPGKLFCMEVVREETNPRPGEPQYNLNRYVFGNSTTDGKPYGIDTTTWESSDEMGQIADHWAQYDEYRKRHFPEIDL